MAEFIYDRDATTVIVLRVPRRLWDQWEFRHGHYGKAIHALRESAIELMAAKSLNQYGSDHVDPFYRE